MQSHLTDTPVAHGGALTAALKKYGGTKADWLDLSTGINPVSAPLPKIGSRIWQALPDLDLLENCLISARRFYGFPQGASLVAAPGVQALIQLLLWLREGAKAAVLGPTYGEYAHVFQTLGSGARIINSTDDLADETIVIIVNPNNPDGRIIEKAALLKLVKTQAAKGGLLIVDEAFCDLTPELSMASKAGRRGLLVLKSFGKFFGLAGVRLGFAAGHADDIAILQSHLGPWAVSGPALVIGAASYGNDVLSAKITEAILLNSTAQAKIFSSQNLKLVADIGLFHLIEHGNAKTIHEGLARHKILTRSFIDQPNWLRLGLCKNADERARLALALSTCLSKL